MRLRYSRELRNLIYYEYGTLAIKPKIAVYRGKRYAAVPGILLSSFRPVRLLLSYRVARKSITNAIRKFVVVKSTANDNVTISSNDKICNIYDVQCLKDKTGKAATIAERIAMRLATLHAEFDNWWNLRKHLRKQFYTGDIDPASKLVVLALYYVKNKLAMAMFTFDLNSIFAEAVPIFFKKLRYGESLYIHHDDYIVIVTKPVDSVGYHSLYKAYIRYMAAYNEIESQIRDEERNRGGIRL